MTDHVWETILVSILVAIGLAIPAYGLRRQQRARRLAPRRDRPVIRYHGKEQ